MPTWSNASFPNSSGAISLLILATALETPFPIQRFLSPSRSSIASFSPVEAPDGTAARPHAPLSSVTSASTVGFPRESKICRPLISRIALILPSQAAEKVPQLRSRLDKILTGDPAASPLSGAHRLGAPYSSHRAPQRVRLRFSLTYGLGGCLFEQP